MQLSCELPGATNRKLGRSQPNEKVSGESTSYNKEFSTNKASNYASFLIYIYINIKTSIYIYVL